MKNKDISVIYGIKNIYDNKIYIGSAKNFRTRKNSHLHCLRKNKHHSQYLQNAYNKYGEESFEFIILEVLCLFDKKVALEKENSWIQHYESAINGYNIQKIACSNGKYLQPVREDTKRKISESLKIVTRTPEYREKCRKRELGKKLSQETKEKIRLGNINKKNYNVEKATFAKYKRVGKIDSNGKVIEQYNSLQEAAKKNDISWGTVSNHCRKIPKKIKFIYI